MKALTLLSALIGISLFACSSDTTTPPASTTPTITITSPAGGATVTVGTDAMKSVPVSFAVTNFTLMAVGTCPKGSTSCGHIHLVVDGTTCTPPMAFYNNAATDSSMPVNAQLASCPKATGAHTITLELHDDMHNPVNDASGKVISASVSIMAQ